MKTSCTFAFLCTLLLYTQGQGSLPSNCVLQKTTTDVGGSTSGGNQVVCASTVAGQGFISSEKSPEESSEENDGDLLWLFGNPRDDDDVLYDSQTKLGNEDYSEYPDEFNRDNRATGGHQFMRFGRDHKFMRFGRDMKHNFMRFGRSGSNVGHNFMRFGRQNDLGHKFMRFGRGENMGHKFMRFGKSIPLSYDNPIFSELSDVSDEDNSPRNDDSEFQRDLRDKGHKFMRFGRASPTHNFMRFGRNPGHNFMRFGRIPEHTFMRFGRNSFSASKSSDDDGADTSRSSADHTETSGGTQLNNPQANSDSSSKVKRDGHLFMRFGRK